jgi:hypothetical protein
VRVCVCVCVLSTTKTLGDDPEAAGVGAEAAGKVFTVLLLSLESDDDESAKDLGVFGCAVGKPRGEVATSTLALGRAGALLGFATSDSEDDELSFMDDELSFMATVIK